MKNLQILEIKYIPATNTRGERVKISNNRFNESIIVSYDYEQNNVLEVALNILKRNDLVIGSNWDEKRNVFNLVLLPDVNNFLTLDELF